MKEILSKIKVEDVSVDQLGRVILTNPNIFSDLIVKDPGVLATNYGCCTNGALCKKQPLNEVIGEVRNIGREIK